MANTSKTWPTLRRARHLGVTVLAEHHGALCRRLAGPVEQRFLDVEITVSAKDAVTLDDGLARFECSVHAEVAAGDHTLVLLALHAVDDPAGEAGLDRTDPTGAAPPSPLVFHRSVFGRVSAAEAT